MVNSLPAVVIDNGSSSTRAGFALEDLPSVVFSSNYAVDENKNVLIGDDQISSRPDLEVMTLLDNGLVYDWENIVKNWEFVYLSLDGGNGVESKDHPLVLTEQPWNTPKNKAAAAQIAFENLEAPLFSLVKSPLAQLYHMGRSSGFVVDVGAGVTSVTPILDGIIQLKLCFHSKYAGDFVNLHAMRSIESKLGYEPSKLDYTRLLPPTVINASPSFQQYHITQNVLRNFKQTVLSVQEPPPGFPPTNAYYTPAVHRLPGYFQLPDRTHVYYNDAECSALLEPLFLPHLNKFPDIPIPDPAFDKAHTHGVSNLVLYTLKNLESTLVSSTGDAQSLTANARFNEILRQFFSSMLITGGTSLIPGFVDRLCGDITRSAPSVFSNYMIASAYKIYISPLRNHGLGDINDTFDKKFGSWLGAASLANMLNESVEDENGNANIALDNWFISKADYNELGEDLIAEKFK